MRKVVRLRQPSLPVQLKRLRQRLRQIERLGVRSRRRRHRGRSAPERPLVAPPVVGRLVGDAGVMDAIGQVVCRLAAAEVELAAARDRRSAIGRSFRSVPAVSCAVRPGYRSVPALVRPRSHRPAPCCRASTSAGHPHHVAGGAGLARARDAGRRAFSPARQAQAVHLADHGVSGNSAKLGGDLARRQAVGP